MTKAKKVELSKVTPVRRRLPRVSTHIKAGPARRTDIDHVGLYNFVVEISGGKVQGA